MSTLNPSSQSMPSPDPIARMSERLDQTHKQIRAIIAQVDEQLHRLDHDDEVRSSTPWSRRAGRLRRCGRGSQRATSRVRAREFAPGSR